MALCVNTCWNIVFIIVTSALMLAALFKTEANSLHVSVGTPVAPLKRNPGNAPDRYFRVGAMTSGRCWLNSRRRKQILHGVLY